MWKKRNIYLLLCLQHLHVVVQQHHHPWQVLDQGVPLHKPQVEAVTLLFTSEQKLVQQNWYKKHAELIQITTLKSVKIQKQSSTLNFTQFSQPHKKDQVSWI